MKKVFICAFALLCVAVNVDAQQSVTSTLKERKEIRKASKSELNEKASKAARKDAKKLSKEGWQTAPGALPLEKQLDKSYMMQMEDETIPPVVLPEGDKDTPIESQPIPIKDVVTPPAPEPQPVPISPIKEQRNSTNTIEFFYCGTKCKVRIDNTISLNLSDCSNDKLSGAWTMLSRGELMNNTIRDCLYLRESLNLCDWAYLNLLSTFTKKLYGKSNEATMLTSYIYCESGYKMRLGRNGSNICLLYACKHGIYDVAYFEIDNINFYPFECEPKHLEICDASYPQEQPLSLFITKNQKFES